MLREFPGAKTEGLFIVASISRHHNHQKGELEPVPAPETSRIGLSASISYEEPTVRYQNGAESKGFQAFHFHPNSCMPNLPFLAQIIPLARMHQSYSPSRRIVDVPKCLNGTKTGDFTRLDV